MTPHPIHRDDRQVLLAGRPAGWICYAAITRSWIFSADPGGEMYRRYVSYDYSGPLLAFEGLECADLDALMAFLGAGGALFGWTVRRYDHYLLARLSLERADDPPRLAGRPADFAALAERVADDLEPPPWR